MPIEKITKDTEVTQSAEWFEKQYQHAYIDLNQKPKKPEGLIAIGTKNHLGKTENNWIMTKGELSVISAPSKSFKSTLKSHLAAVFFKGFDDQFPDFKGNRKQNDSVIDVDTEQGSYYSWWTFHRTKRLCHGLDISNHYFPFKLRHLLAEERVDFIDMAIKSNRVKKPALVFIDGIADLVWDTNDLLKSNEVVNKIMQWTDLLNIHVCVIIHNAYGSKKPTGHTGSSATKKCESLLSLAKLDEENDNENIYKVSQPYSRGAGFKDFYFKYNPTKGCLYEVDDLGTEKDDIAF